MRSLSSRERRLLMSLLVAGFFILNFLGYQSLAQRRTAALSQQRTLRFDIARLKELQAVKPTVDITSDWVNARLPAYTDIDQLETHLFNVVANKAVGAGVELSKKDPRPTEKNPLVHKSILEIETTAEMENLVNFLHSLQGRDDFRFISFLELTPTKDEERVRCQARVEQWWRPDSDELAGIVTSDVPRLPQVPLSRAAVTTTLSPTSTDRDPEESAPSNTDDASDNAAGDAPPAVTPPASAEGESPAVEQPAAESVQPPSAE